MTRDKRGHTLCPICGKFIYNARPGQKYHQDGCSATAAKVSKLRSLLNKKLDAILTP